MYGATAAGRTGADSERRADKGHSAAREVRSLTASDIRYAFDGEKEILHGLTVSLKKGGMTALVGESGSGKTTLLKVLMGLYESPSARFAVNGGSATDPGALVAYASSESQLFPVSVYENITMGRTDIPPEKCAAMIRRLGFSSWLEGLPDGLDTVLAENAVNLSGGQRQMINNARALLSGRPVLILDEPFSALDPERQQCLLDVLADEKQRRIILITSHRPDTVAVCDQVIQLEA